MQPVAEREGLAVAVGDVEHRDAPGLVPAPEVVHDVALNRVVERRQRLVEQQRVGIGDERPGERRPLTFAAGNLVRATAEQPFDVERLGGLDDALLPLAARQRRQAVADVLRHGHVREQRELLEDVAEAALGHRNVPRGLAVEQHPLADGDASGVRPGEAGDAAQDGGLARTGGAEEDRDARLDDGTTRRARTPTTAA